MDYQELLNQIAQMLEDQTRQINLKIENEVSKRIDSLFDGSGGAHEKQWELEHRTDQLQSQVNDLQARLATLENKIA